MKNPDTSLSLGLALQPRRLQQVLTALLAVVVLGLTISLSKQRWLVVALLGSALLLLVLAFRFNNNGRTEQAASLMLITLTSAVSGLVRVGACLATR